MDEVSFIIGAFIGGIGGFIIGAIFILIVWKSSPKESK